MLSVFKSFEIICNEHPFKSAEKIIFTDASKAYEATTDFFLIDTKDPDSTIGIGATGATHDREIDRRIIESTDALILLDLAPTLSFWNSSTLS